ncbi:hypothetical protein [Chitinilyticum aquatile]|uniref:hypothetical protein n=1 Tax=Chitinilyticum aquatile TaxID=362520 RepID=UPI00041D8DFA|nr:hypothetical protein [Chitinilyticum aquatile]
MNHTDIRPFARSGYYSVAEYNARIASAQACRAGIEAFWQKAAEAGSTADWEYYAAAARDMEVFAPKVEAQARKLARALGLSEAQFGRIITLEECELLGQRSLANLHEPAVA